MTNLFLSNRLKKALKGNLLPFQDISNIYMNPKRRELTEWLLIDLDILVDEFFKSELSSKDRFINTMNRIFKTWKFCNLLKKYYNEYLFNLILKIDYCFYEKNSKEKLKLEDNPLNRFAIAKYKFKFNITPKIEWVKQPKFLFRLTIVFFQASNIIYQGIRTGFIIFKKRKKYKVMRELKWGFKGINGNYFHDDFMVDNNKIRPKDLLIFIRHIPEDTFGIKTYETLKRSPYDFFDLRLLPISIYCFMIHILPKYLVFGCLTLLSCINSQNFSLFSTIFYQFIVIGMPQEKIFSNYEISSQFGHNTFSYAHIVEAIVCNNYGARYYLCQLSDSSMREMKDVASFLGCDYIFAWGNAHKSLLDTNFNTFLPTGYVFKSFIKQVCSNKADVMDKMKLNRKRKNIVFFEENFGGPIKITAECYIQYWETILAVWKKLKDNINIIIKTKDIHKYLVDSLGLNESLKKRSIEIIDFLSKTGNFYVLGYPEWSFIELIGIADVVVTHGMTSSSTIAIISGIEGIYFDRIGWHHPFARLFKDKIVFSDSDRLVEMTEKIITGKDSVFKIIPENLLQEFNNDRDGSSIDLVREFFSGNYNILASSLVDREEINPSTHPQLKSRGFRSG